MNKDGFQGISFGIMDGIITVLGVMMGLSATSNSRIVFIGILAAGIADAFANAAGFYASEETENIHSKKEVWNATILCFIATLMVMVVLVLPLLFFDISYAIVVSEILGIVMLVFLGYFVSNVARKGSAWRTILEYVVIGLAVSFVCYILGQFASTFI
jgi:VIT1/CCC1 family predicted Fe2+/Mn2+ transporter